MITSDGGDGTESSAGNSSGACTRVPTGVIAWTKGNNVEVDVGTFSVVEAKVDVRTTSGVVGKVDVRTLSEVEVEVDVRSFSRAKVDVWIIFGDFSVVGVGTANPGVVSWDNEDGPHGRLGKSIKLELLSDNDAQGCGIESGFIFNGIGFVFNDSDESPFDGICVSLDPCKLVSVGNIVLK